MEYKVAKQHYGDRQYFEGDTREVKVKGDADILIGMGLIVDPKAAQEKLKADKEAEKRALEADEVKAKADAEKVKQEADAQAEKNKADANTKAEVDAEKEAPKTKNKMAKDPANKSE